MKIFSINQEILHLPIGLLGTLFLVVIFCTHVRCAAASDLDVQVSWRYHAPSGSCEIPAYDHMTNQLFITVDEGVDVVEGNSGMRCSTLNSPQGYKPTSISCHKGKVAIAWAAEDKHLRGKISIYDANDRKELASFAAGFLPDMVTFTPDGKYVLTANEGEPTDDYSFDPEGSVTIIDISEGISSATTHEAKFSDFNSCYDKLSESGIRLYGSNKPNSNPTVAQDLEPEYIAVSSDSNCAWITLQENNAIAELDLKNKRITKLHPLGLKDFSKLSSDGLENETTGFDASDRDAGAKIRHWPVLGLYQPDGITLFEHAGKTYLITANEGDPRDYIDFSESLSIRKLESKGITLDQEFRAQFLMAPEHLGRLKVSTVSGDTDEDGDLDELHCFGTRSFSIWHAEKSGALNQVYDSGSDFERITANQAPHRFNADSTADNLPDVRSRTRGPEPESVVVGRVVAQRLAMVGLERTGGIMIYDISTPESTRFIKYVQPYFEDEVLDCAPEGLLFISKEDSPLKMPMLIVCNEASSTTTAYTLQWK